MSLNYPNAGQRYGSIPRCDEARLVGLLSDLVRIPSIGEEQGEGQVADFLRRYLHSHGIDAELQEVLPGRPNLIARLGNGNGPRLLFNAHTDVVVAGEGWSHSPFSGNVEHQQVFGRGTVDDKGSLAAMVEAMLSLQGGGIHLEGALILAAVMDEEGASLGSKSLVRSVAAELAIVGEPTGGKIVIAHNGSLRPVIRVTGTSAHSSRPEDGVNAIDKMATFVLSLGPYHRRLRQRTHPLTGSASIAVTRIEGGRQVNMIPDQCTAVIDRRLVPGETEEAALREIGEMLQAQMQEDPGLRIAIDSLIPTTGGPAQIDEAAEVVQTLRTVVRQVSQREPEFDGMGGACDMVHLIGAGIPTVVYGPGDPGLAHKPDEHIAITDLVDAAQVYAGFAMKYLTGGRPER